jgi:hypothetical protein
MFRILTLCFALSVTSAWSQVVINEICPANADINYDTRFYNFSGWIELYNPGSSSINLTGYYISNDPDQIKKWPIPYGTNITPKGYVLIWCNEQSVGLHSNFTLRTKGGHVLLTNNNLVVDRIEYPSQYTNISYGRKSDGGSEWSYLGNPTPSRTNAGGLPGKERLKAPTFSIASGKYGASQNLVLSNTNGVGEIRYTIDGSEPTKSSSLFVSNIQVSTVTTIKAKIFANDYLPSETVTNTYFIGTRNFTLPVVSLSTIPAYLTDNTIGIYVNGTNGAPGNCQDGPRNFNQDWERHGVLEYFDASGKRQFIQDVDMSIAGGCSRGNPQRSFGLKARNKYGSNTFDDFRFFDTKQLYSYGSLLLRNGGNDFWSTFFRDVLMQEILRDQMDVDAQAFQPVILYRNGQYQGIMNLREKVNPDYIESNYGYDADEIDMMEVYGNPMTGSNAAYQTYLNTLQSMNLSTAQAFEFIDRNIDVQEYINYLVAQIYYGNTDWPGNNMKYWRHRDGGKFRWILYDTDFGFSDINHQTLYFVTDATKTEWPNPAWSTLHIRLLLSNPIFRERFIQTFSTALHTTFEPSRVHTIIDDIKSRYATEMPYHFTKWGSNSVGNWNNQVAFLKTFATQRNTFMRQHLASYFNLGGDVSLTFNGTPARAAGFEVNGVSISGSGNVMKHFKGISYTVKPVPQPGYRFVRWNIKKQASESIQYIAREDTWKYFDQGSLPSATWFSATYDDSGWASGQGQLGYGENDEKTVVQFGPDANNKYVTTYFRKTFTIDNLEGLTDITASMIYDDGAIVYVNGIEVFRGNMPAGTVGYGTYSLSNSPAENVYHAFTIPNSVLVAGENVVAVEIHQLNATSTDLSFDLEMKGGRLGEITTETSEELLLEDIANTDIEFEAVFEEVSKIASLIINEIVPSNSVYEDEHGDTDDFIEIYNPNNVAVDLAGLYISDKLSNKLKHKISVGKEEETIIPPYGYKILWADQEIFQGPLHLNFKLSSGGEEVGLFQKVGEVFYTLDQAVFGTVYSNSSMSRIPNATGAFVMTGTMTPGYENFYEVPLGTEEGHYSGVHVYPNPTNGVLTIDADVPVEQVQVFNALGKLVLETSTKELVSLTDFSPGLYFLIIQLDNQRITKRVIKQ